MNSFKKIFIVSGILLGMASCFDKSRPNYQYMPNMYMPVGYETYEKVDFLPRVRGTTSGGQYHQPGMAAL